jgi:Protein of unknown function (DUF2809)
LLLTEIVIVKYVHDDFVRPFFGDFLVVILIYSFIKTFVKIPVLKTATLVLLFAFSIEILRYFRIVEVLGLSKNRFWATVIGTAFSWGDMLAYTLGIISILFFEKQFNPTQP